MGQECPQCNSSPAIALSKINGSKSLLFESKIIIGRYPSKPYNIELIQH